MVSPIYNIQIQREDLKMKLAKEKVKTGKNIHRLIEDILDEHFAKEK